MDNEELQVGCHATCSTISNFFSLCMLDIVHATVNFIPLKGVSDCKSLTGCVAEIHYRLWKKIIVYVLLTIETVDSIRGEVHASRHW